VIAVAGAGWAVAAALGLVALGLGSRLELVARAEHELRGPITALSLALEGLKRDPTRRELAEALETQLDRAQAGLVDLGAARSGRRATERPARLPLERYLRHAAAGWDAVARREGRSVSVAWSAGPIAVCADRRRIGQAIGNLVANALEHGGGDVTLHGHRLAGRLRLDVEDAGSGFRDGGERSRDRGRGLAIAARAVEAAGGSVTVLPRANGAAVALELPLDES